MTLKTLAKLNNLAFFSKESLKQYERSEAALNFNLKYWIKKGIIIRLKNGIYITKERWEKEQNKNLYLEYLANKLYEPSYLSCEYVMAKYGLLSEAVYAITSITTKKTSSFSNQLGSFNYYSLSPKLFFGYSLEKYYSSAVFIAKKTKAVFDYLYLRFLKTLSINKKMIEEMRINWDNIKKNEFTEINKFAKSSGSKRIVSVINLVNNLYYA